LEQGVPDVDLHYAENRTASSGNGSQQSSNLQIPAHRPCGVTSPSWRFAMLELIVTVTYAIGLLYLVPKIQAEFRQEQPRIQQPVNIQQPVDDEPRMKIAA
jgi:hypothetical protein